jgi:hypothetical protein
MPRYRASVRSTQVNYFISWRQTLCLAACLLGAGCAAHKQPQPLPTFPPVPITALRQLPALPPRNSYDRVAILTVEAESGDQLARSISRIRETAAQKGADALVVLQDTEVPQKSGKRRLPVRRITYLAIHRR